MIPLRNYLPIMFFCLSLASGQAQDFCKPILDKAELALRQGDFTKAIKELQSAETCDFQNTLLSKRQVLQNKVFDAIQQQKEAAIRDRLLLDIFPKRLDY